MKYRVQFAILAASIFACQLFGCGSAFTNIAAQSIAEHELRDGSVVRLSQKKSVNHVTGKKSSELQLDYLMGSSSKTYSVDANENQEDSYALRVDADMKRAWVIRESSKRAVFSVDFVKEQVWTDASDQPKWAIGG